MQALCSAHGLTGTKPESDRLTTATQAKGSVRTQSTAHGPQLPDTFSATLNGEKNMRKPSRSCTRKNQTPNQPNPTTTHRLRRQPAPLTRSFPPKLTPGLPVLPLLSPLEKQVTSVSLLLVPIQTSSCLVKG